MLRRHRVWLVVVCHSAFVASVSGTVVGALDDLPGLGPISFWPAAAAMYAPTVGAAFDPFADWRERTAARSAGPTAALLLAFIVVPTAWSAIFEPDGTVAHVAALWALGWTALGCAAAATRVHGVTWLAPAGLLVAAVFGSPPAAFVDPRWWSSSRLVTLSVAVVASAAGLAASADRRWRRYGPN